MSGSKAFFGGMPTEIDVKRLVDAFGVPEEGKLIPYGDIEKAIGVRHGSDRFRTVTDAWRRRLERENNAHIIAVTDQGFKHASPSERVSWSIGKFKGGLRSIGRGAMVAASTDRARLTDEEKKVCDHVHKTGASLRLMAQVEARRLRWDAPE